MYNTIWQKCLLIIKKKVKANTFNHFFKPLKLIELSDEEALIELGDQMNEEGFKIAHQKNLEDAFKQLTGKKIKINFKSTKKNNPSQTSMNLSFEYKPLENDKKLEAYKYSNLNRKFLFENFVVGTCNEFAFTASKKVAEKHIESDYNPLFIYGASGLGKTHLVQAIGNTVLDGYKNYKVCYITSEEFTNNFIQSIHQGKGKINAFTQHFRSFDLLIVDDVHFFGKKEQTQESFFHTFNSMHNSGKQIVLTSDRPPVEIKDVETRLVTRFQSGLVVDIQPPDLETRIAILMRKARYFNLNLDNDVLYFIANNFTSNIRELEGVIKTLSVFYTHTGQQITLNHCKELLYDLIPKKQLDITIEKIQKIVSKYHNVNETQLIDKGRAQKIATPRMIAMYLCRELTDETLENIGLKFGRRDHSTVSNAIDKITERLNIDIDLRNKINDIKHLIEIS